MELHEEQVGGVTAIAVGGRLDSTSAPALDERLRAAVSRPGAGVVVDLARLAYISSAGFRVLLLAAKEAEATGSRLVLCGLAGPVRQLFEIGGFLPLFKVAESRADALTRAGR